MTYLSRLIMKMKEDTASSSHLDPQILSTFHHDPFDLTPPPLFEASAFTKDPIRDTQVLFRSSNPLQFSTHPYIWAKRQHLSGGALWEAGTQLSLAGRKNVHSDWSLRASFGFLHDLLQHGALILFLPRPPVFGLGHPRLSAGISWR